MTTTPGLDEILRLLPSSEKRRRVLPVPVYATSLIGSEVALPGCPCDRAEVIEPACLAIGECPNPCGGVK